MYVRMLSPINPTSLIIPMELEGLHTIEMIWRLPDFLM